MGNSEQNNNNQNKDIQQDYGIKNQQIQEKIDDKVQLNQAYNKCDQYQTKEYKNTTGSTEDIQLIEDMNKDLPIVAVIVTFYSLFSFDDLFHSVKQVVKDGRVQIYSTTFKNIPLILESLQKEKTNVKLADQFASEAKALEPQSVLFNWECCSGCQNTGSTYSFSNKNEVLSLMKYAIDHKHMMMFSDFAVKALINIWDEAILGPKIFIQAGECRDYLQLSFVPGILKECCSSQLKMVGELSEEGSSKISALPNTVVIGLNKNCNKDAMNQVYDLQVLTIVTDTQSFNIKNQDKQSLHTIKDQEGTIGHAILTYKSGATLLVSAGHWIELSKLNVNVNNLEKVANFQYGDGNMYTQQITEIKAANINEIDKQCQYEQIAQKFVQQCIPNSYSKNQKINNSKQ